MGARGSERLAGGLTQRGHEVVMFAHPLLGALHCGRRVKPDVAVLFAAGSSPLSRVTHAYGIPTVINAELGDSSGAVEEYERLLESVVAMAGPGWLPAELVDAPERTRNLV